MPRKTLEMFDPTLLIEESRTPPYQWYTDQDFYEKERHEIFERCWIPVGRLDQIPRSGDYFTGNLMGNPYVVVRSDDKLHAHHNVCRHKGAAVADGYGRLASGCFSCPYHGWKYDFSGSLKSAPLLGKQAVFDRERSNLYPIAVDTWGPFIFLDMDGPFGGSENPRNLHKDLEPIKPFLENLGVDNLRFYERRVYNLDCNWKVFVDNSLDGGYHVSYAHEGLAAGLEFEGYETHVLDRSAVQICKTNDSDERLGSEVV